MRKVLMWTACVAAYLLATVLATGWFEAWGLGISIFIGLQITVFLIYRLTRRRVWQWLGEPKETR